MLSPEMILAISLILSSVFNSCTFVSVKLFSISFLIKNCCCALPAICGECVTHIIWVFLESSLNFSATLLTVSPEIPVSISSKISTEILSTAENTVDVQLDDLNMENAKFKVEIRKTQEITMHGIDNAEFMIATNVGETFKPLAKIASGGEISRIMLALKTVFSAVDNISVLIFDEIDTGISGETVRRVAEKLRELSKNTQIICVTHSPQIAGKAQQQFFIKKEIENNFTETKVHELNTEERIREIARIISGDNITEASINHAKEIMGLWDKKVLV